jgi:hypothetical protein
MVLLIVQLQIAAPSAATSSLLSSTRNRTTKTIMDGFKHERTLQKKTQVPECPSEPIDDKPTTNSLVKRRKEERIGFLLLTRNAYLQMEFLCVRKFAPETQNPSKDQQ